VGYSFTSTPNYNKLRMMLMRCINQVGSSFNQVYDWNKKYESLLSVKNEVQVRVLRNKPSFSKVDSSSSMATTPEMSTRASINPVPMLKGLTHSPSGTSQAVNQPSVLVEASNEH